MGQIQSGRECRNVVTGVSIVLQVYLLQLLIRKYSKK